MTQKFDFEGNSIGDAEQTLQLLAKLPAPDELTDRVHARLHAHARRSLAQEHHARRSVWSLWSPARRLQFAAAATLAVAISGSVWRVYRSNGWHAHPSSATSASHANPTPASPPNASSSSGFQSAAAQRVPPTLRPIKVPPAPKKKPNAGVRKPMAKPASAPADSAPSGTETKP